MNQHLYYGSYHVYFNPRRRTARPEGWKEGQGAQKMTCGVASVKEESSIAKNRDPIVRSSAIGKI